MRKNFIKSFQSLKNRLLTRFIFSILICFILTSCFEVKQKINISKDGSGNTRLEIAVQKEMLFNPRAITEFKNNLKKEGWNILREVEKEGKLLITAGRKFKNISELNDDKTRYTFSSERKGFMRNSYILEIEHIEDYEIPFPFQYEISTKVPGSVDETNGKKISSNVVKWNLEGLQEGIVLYVRSSAFTIPVLAWLLIFLILMFAVLLLFVGVVIVSKIIKPTIPKSRVTSRGVFCIQCGKENPAIASFCTNCGHKLE